MKSILAELNELVYRLGAYDRMAVLMTLGLDNYIRRTYSREIPRCRRLLDIGTGTGRNIPHVKNKAESIICIDLSYTALRTCLEKYRCDSRIDIVCASAEMIPIRNSTIDVVLSSYVLRHLDLTRFVKEIRRVTCRGSRVILVDFWKPRTIGKQLLLLTHLSIIVTLLSFLTFPSLVVAYVGVWKNIPKLHDPLNIAHILSYLGRVEMMSIVDIIYIWKIEIV
ncbi:MAG: class I SAM-dependent methyltransferase [Crenarchaeota archaeon]|nr:class I SAM-dependent methyltransferase [Thermoproteota archaeon]